MARTPAAAARAAICSGLAAKQRAVAGGITSRATISRMPTILIATAITVAVSSPNIRRVHSGRRPATVAKSTLTVVRKRLSAHGYYATPGIHYDAEREHGHPFAYHVCGTAVDN